jgi:hypothetical protein
MEGGRGRVKILFLPPLSHKGRRINLTLTLYYEERGLLSPGQ